MNTYTPKEFDLPELQGLSEKQIEAHLATPPASDWCGEIVFSVK